MSSEEGGRAGYLDLLISTLMEHEKNLDALIEKMEKMCENLSKVYEETKGSRKASVEASALKRKIEVGAEEPDTLVYLKIKISRPIDEVVRILEALK